jgi:hypothetical protein
MADKAARIGEIIAIMRDNWDLPPDCNDGELFTYAKILFDRIEAGNEEPALHAYLVEVQAKLDIPESSVPQIIIDRALGLKPVHFGRVRSVAPPRSRRIISGPYLAASASVMAWREDNRREANGAQFRANVGLVAKNKPSVDFCGPWQRAKAT